MPEPSFATVTACVRRESSINALPPDVYRILEYLRKAITWN